MNHTRFSLFTSLACAAGASGLLHAADTTTTSQQDNTLLLDNVVVSASALKNNQADMAQASTVLSGARLSQNIHPTLGETLANEPGMASTYFGPGASRPIIRGQGGDRLKLLENGSGTLDASGTSPDHAVSIEPFLIKRIEIVRGPASLLYGSSASGGVVNVLTHRIDSEAPAERSSSDVMGRFDSASSAWTVGGSTDQVLFRRETGALVFHLDGFKRESEDLRIPGNPVRAGLLQDGTQSPPSSTQPIGRLPGSQISGNGGALGLSFIGPDFHLGASYSGDNVNYGVPGPESLGPDGGVHIELRQRRVDVQGELTRDLSLFKALRFKFGHADYRHKEVEPDGAVGTQFQVNGFDSRIEGAHSAAEGHLTGVIGAQAADSKMAISGAEAFLPPTDTTQHAAFAFENYALGPLSIEAGVRSENQRIQIKDTDTQRTEQPFGVSTGLVWKHGKAWSASLSLAHTQRAPNAQELFADGPHAGTNAFEIGDPRLAKEQVRHLEFGLRKLTGLVTGQLSAYSDHFGDFISDQATGLVAVERQGDWLQTTASSLQSNESGLPVYKYSQGHARFIGFEAESLWHLHKGESHSFDLKVVADAVRATGDKDPLPRIPPFRTTLGLQWRRTAWSAGVDWQHAFAQNRIAPLETADHGYELLGAQVARSLRLWQMDWDLFAKAGNLLDREIRLHTSYLKDYAPLAGRSLSLGASLHF